LDKITYALAVALLGNLRVKKFLQPRRYIPPLLLPLIARMPHLGATPTTTGAGGCPPLRNNDQHPGL
jgi:hypothetical protein